VLACLRGEGEVQADVLGKGRRFALTHQLTSMQREMLLAGGGLRWLRMHLGGTVPVAATGAH
jgi:hypothetical protein